MSDIGIVYTITRDRRVVSVHLRPGAGGARGDRRRALAVGDGAPAAEAGAVRVRRPDVLFIASLFVVSEGLDATGVTAWAGSQLIARAGESRARLVLLTMLLVAALTAVISVNGAVAALLPVAVVMPADRAGAPSQLLIHRVRGPRRVDAGADRHAGERHRLQAAGATRHGRSGSSSSRWPASRCSSGRSPSSPPRGPAPAGADAEGIPADLRRHAQDARGPVRARPPRCRGPDQPRPASRR